MENITKTDQCLLYLMACALHSTPPQEDVLTGIDLNQLLARAQDHSVAAMVCFALEKTQAFAAADSAVQKQWQDAKNKAIRKNLLLDTERRAILQELDAAGIWYAPLKGSILKDWYPQFGMREMSDNDILYDGSHQEEVHEVFLRRNYEVKNYKIGFVDEYDKPPIYYYEMHTALFSHDMPALCDYYATVKDRLRLVPGTRCEYAFTPEDFYVFVLAHAYKHYSNGGTGVRTLADVYVMHQHFGGALDTAYVRQQLEQLGCTAYERDSRILAEKLFGTVRASAEITLTEAETAMLQYQLGASTYGTTRNAINNRLSELAPSEMHGSFSVKLKYCLARLFPGFSYIKGAYPELYPTFRKCPLLFPPFWVWRFFRRLRVNGTNIRHELHCVCAYKPDTRDVVNQYRK